MVSHPTYEPAIFVNRWRISGTLTSTQVLHIGSGESIAREGFVNENTGDKIAISGIARGYGEPPPPIIPGASLRGVLRSLFMAHDQEMAVELFGSEDAQEAGKLVVHDAPLTEVDGSNHLPAWSATQQTGVIPNVAISRQTRTAAEEKLYHREVVPAGASFQVELQADNIDESVIHALLLTLDAGLCLGANTSSGWGRVQWQSEAVQVLLPSDRDRWLEAGDPLAPLPWQTIAPRGSASHIANNHQGTKLQLLLKFDEFFLTKDAWASRKPSDGQAKTQSRRDPDGKPFLPASAFRGVFRSHAEKVLRSLGLGAADPSAEPQPKITIDDNSKVHVVSSIQGDDLSSRLFGAAGWRTTIGISDFLTHTDSNPVSMTHEMVAIDRFTGMVAGSRKFTAIPWWQPELTGEITFERHRWDAVGISEWAEGLLVLVLRDMIDGDLTFGLGASHGYGACQLQWADEASQAWWHEAAPQALERFQEWAQSTNLT